MKCWRATCCDGGRARVRRGSQREWLGRGCTDPRIYVGRAPGRLDVMGGIADYSGSLVLPIAELPACGREERHATYLHTDAIDGGATFELPVAELSRVASYEDARSPFDNKPGGDWAAYALLLRRAVARVRARFTEGCNIRSTATSRQHERLLKCCDRGSTQAITKAFEVSLDRFPGLVPGVPCSRGMKVGLSKG